MVMCMLLRTVICSPRLKCPVLCADFIVLVFCIFIPYCCDFVLPFSVIKNNNNIITGLQRQQSVASLMANNLPTQRSV